MEKWNEWETGQQETISPGRQKKGLWKPVSGRSRWNLGEVLSQGQREVSSSQCGYTEELSCGNSGVGESMVFWRAVKKEREELLSNPLFVKLPALHPCLFIKSGRRVVGEA